MKVKYLFPVAFVIFVGGLVTFLVSATSRPLGTTKAPFVITHVRYWKSAPEKKTVIVRLVNESGDSFEKMLARDGTDYRQTQVHYDLTPPNPAEFTASEFFVRTENIFGLTAYVFRQPLDDGEVIETWRSLETGPVALKQIIEKPDGGAFVQETTSLEFRPISAKEVEPNPELLIEFPRTLRQ